MEKLYDENSDIENQKQQFVHCFRCNVKLHYLCEKRLSQNTHFVQCIYCQSIGTIDTFDHNIIYKKIYFYIPPL